MRLRSTGLGRTELEGELVGVKKVEDLVMFFVNTTKPVKWQTRMAFQEKDLRDLVAAFMKPSNLLFVLKALFLPGKEIPEKEDF